MSGSEPQKEEFGELYDAYVDQIYGYIYRRIGNTADAEDITSIVFFKALNAFKRFRWQGLAPSAWLYRIASNEVVTFFRRHRHREQSLDDGYELVTNAADPQAEMERQENAQMASPFFRQVSLSLQNLKPLDQTLLSLRFFENKSYAQIAEIVGKREGAVTMRTRRALEKMRAQLKAQGYDDESVQRCLEQDGETQSIDRSLQKRVALPPSG